MLRDKYNVLRLFVFGDKVTLYNSFGCPKQFGTSSVYQAGLKLGDLPASASQVLGLKVCTTTVWYIQCSYFVGELLGTTVLKRKKSVGFYQGPTLL